MNLKVIGEYMKKRLYLDDDEFETTTTEQQNEVVVEEFGCFYCWDKNKNRNKELFFLDAANNMRECHYCPSCGRKF